MKYKKPMLSAEEQIVHLKNKGVLFDKITEEEALRYLKENNNYFKLTAYRKNFSKHPDGINKDRYISLDFAYLKDLAIIDMKLRYTLVQMAFDIEHFTRVNLLKIVSESEEDGYSIVSDYIDSLETKQKCILENEIARNKDNIYCGDIISKYDGDYPIWAFVEIIPFGRLISFYKYCANRFDNKSMKDVYYRLLTCKELRNACAHSNCIINDLHTGNTKYKTNNKINRELMKISSITKTTRSKKMSNAHIQQIITLMYTHKELVTSIGVHNDKSEALQLLIVRMNENIEYYSQNDLITSSFKFIKLVVDSWFNIIYT